MAICSASRRYHFCFGTVALSAPRREIVAIAFLVRACEMAGAQASTHGGRGSMVAGMDEVGASEATGRGRPLIRMPAREIAAVAWRHRPALLAALLLPPVLALLSLSMLTPRYEADASVMVKNGREYLTRDEGQVTGQAAPQTTKQEAVNSEIEIMTSRGVAQEVIRRVGLRALYPSIADTATSPAAAMDQAVRRFSRRLKIDAVKISDVIDVGFADRDRAMASRVLSVFLSVYNRRHLAVFGSNNLGRVYEGVIATDLGERDRLEQARSAIKRDNRVFDVDAQRQSLISQRAEAQDDRRRARSRQGTLIERIAFLRRQDERLAPLQVSTETDHNDAAPAAGAAMIDLERTRSQLLSRYAPEHPLVRAVDGQLRAVRAAGAGDARPFVHVRHDPSPLAQQVAEELLLDGAELAPLGDDIVRTGQVIDGLDRELLRIETADTTLRSLVSRIASLDENLAITRAQLERARTQDSLDAHNAMSVSVIQAPAASLRPVFPRVTLTLAAGIVAGGLASVGVLIVLVLLHDGFLTADGLEQALGLRVLARVPHAQGGFAVPV